MSGTFGWQSGLSGIIKKDIAQRLSLASRSSGHDVTSNKCNFITCQRKFMNEIIYLTSSTELLQDHSILIHCRDGGVSTLT
jgi:hypothetical protein